jgi:hypothetical protein
VKTVEIRTYAPPEGQNHKNKIRGVRHIHTVTFCEATMLWKNSTNPGKEASSLTPKGIMHLHLTIWNLEAL